MFSRILEDPQQPLEAIYGPHHRRGRSSYRLVPITVPPSELFGDFDPRNFLVHFEDHGIPQTRRRLFILGITESTVKKHVQEMFNKLGVETRGAAAVRALEVLNSPLSARSH